MVASGRFSLSFCLGVVTSEKKTWYNSMKLSLKMDRYTCLHVTVKCFFKSVTDVKECEALKFYYLNLTI
jgi:hypothetical protein